MQSSVPPAAFILKGYPRLSETFIAQEILELERQGLPITICSLRHPTDTAIHAINRQIAAPVLYLPEYLHQEPLRVLRGWWSARRTPGYPQALRTWLRDFRRDPTRNRIRRFGQAMVLSAELDPKIRRLHAHFLHTPSSVTRYAAMMRNAGWSFSAHAKDIWTTPQWDLREKLEDCAWGTTCTGTGATYLNGLAGSGNAPKVDLIYHGLDLARFPAPPEGRQARDGTDPNNPAVIACVARAVEKKGLDVLLEALARLPTDMHWRLLHIGGGPLAQTLKAQAQALGIDGHIEWRGPTDQDDVIAALREADLFALACRVTPDGDRDGLPNVLMEAQSQALACVATRISAIPEFIQDGETGLLTDPQDPTAFADALASLVRDPAQRATMGANGHARLHKHFRIEPCIRPLARRFNLPEPAGN